MVIIAFPFYDKTLSPEIRIKYGVPQGSVTTILFPSGLKNVSIDLNSTYDCLSNLNVRINKDILCRYPKMFCVNRLAMLDIYIVENVNPENELKCRNIESKTTRLLLGKKCISDYSMFYNHLN